MNTIELTINDLDTVEFESIEVDYDTNYFNCVIGKAYNLKEGRDCTEQELCFIEDNFPNEVWKMAMAQR